MSVLRFSHQHVNHRQKHERGATKKQIALKNDFQPRKDEKNVTSKNELKSRLGALNQKL